MNRPGRRRLRKKFNASAKRKPRSFPAIKKMPRLIAHRGGARTAPENTLAAIKLAAANGADGVEIDVRVTSDGTPVLMHDATLERTTNGKGKVAGTTLAQLRDLDAGSWFDKKFCGEPVPTLAEALKLCARLGMDVVIDIKPAPGFAAEDTKTILKHAVRAWPAARTPPTLNSESVTVLDTAMQEQPDWPRAIVIRRPFMSWKARLRVATVIAAGTRWMGIGWAEAMSNLAKQNGKGLSVWTINKPQDAVKLARHGVDTIFTDTPDTLRRAIKHAMVKPPVQPRRHIKPAA